MFTYTGGATIRFGVVGLEPGGATLDVFRSADGDEVQSAGDFSRTMSITFSAGGLPDSPEAADAVRTVVVTPDASYSPTGGAAHTFTVVLTNSDGDGVAGVTPCHRSDRRSQRRHVDHGGDVHRLLYVPSNNSGTSTCTYKGTRVRHHSLSTIWVDQTFARTTPANPTPGIDNNEPRDTSTATNTVTTAQAKFIDLTPVTSTVVVGNSQVLTAAVTDAGRHAFAVGVPITFTETGPAASPVAPPAREVRRRSTRRPTRRARRPPRSRRPARRRPAPTR